jgi:WD40 repeat protein
VPKVIDFGIAKATQARLTEKTIFTRLNQWIGTPAYMSPEQAGLGSLDVDTRSDIYSLGVLLYELLTGRTPFDTRKLLEAGFDAVMRTIREEEPPKPSTRLSTLGEVELNTVATKRGSDPAKLNRLVRGDLDWIVMKALEKDRTRRYETATDFSQDLERHSKSEPVMAVAPTVGYRALKFARRNRLALATSGVIALLLVVGVMVSSWQAVRATHRAEEAERQRQVATNATDRADRLYEQSEQARRELQRASYRNSIQLAYRQWQAGNVGAADRQLEACPEPLRHWEWYHLRRLCHSERLALFSPTPHEGSKGDGGLDNRVAFSEHGNQIGARMGSRITVWDRMDGHPRGGQDLTNYWLQSLSPSRRIVAAGKSNELCLQEVFTVNGVTNLTIAPLNSDGTVRTICLPQHSQRYGLHVALGSQSVVAFDPEAGKVLVWSRSNGQLTREISGLEPGLNTETIALDAKAQVLAIAYTHTQGRTASHRIVCVDLANGKVMATTPPVSPSHKDLLGKIGCLLVHPSRPWVLMSTWSFNKSADDVFLFDRQTGSLLRSWQADGGKLEVDRFDVVYTSTGRCPVGPFFGALTIQLSPDGTLMAVAAMDGIIRVWSLETGLLVATHRGHEAPVTDVAFSSDGIQLASIDRAGAVKLWDAVKEPGVEKVQVNHWLRSEPEDSTISADGQVIMTPERIWHWRDGYTLEIPEKPAEGSLSPDGSAFVVSGGFSTNSGFRVLSTKTAETLSQIPSHCDWDAQWRFDRDGQTLAVLGRNSRLEVWDIHSAELIFQAAGPGAELGFEAAGLGINYSNTPAGRTVWDAVSGRELLSAPDRTLSVNLCDDGSALAVCQRDAIEVVELATRKRRIFSLPDQFRCDMVRWSPDRSRLLCLSSASDGAFIYDLKRGERQRLTQFPGAGAEAVWSHDGHRIAGVSEGSRVCLWEAETGELVITLDVEAVSLRFTEDDQFLAVTGPRALEGCLRVLDGSRETNSVPPSRSQSLHQRSVRTGVPGLKLAAFLQPVNPEEADNNFMTHCALQPPYLYALGREGTLWTFQLPSVATNSEVLIVHPLSYVKTKARGEDLVVRDKTLFCASGNSVEVYSLDDPAHPQWVGLAATNLGGAGFPMILEGSQLFCFGSSGQTGFLAALDVAQPRQPTVIGFTSLPYHVSDGYIVRDRLVVHGIRPNLTKCLALFDLGAGWPPRLIGEVPCEDWMLWFLPVGAEEILAGNDDSVRRLHIRDGGLPELLPATIDLESRSAVLSRRSDGEFIFLNGSILTRDGDGWRLLAMLPKGRHGDGRTHRASAQGPYVAIPSDYRVWLYMWD